MTGFAFNRFVQQKAHIGSVCSRKLANIASLASAGPDLRTVYLGVLLGSRLPTFRVRAAGLPTTHWHWC